MAVAKRGHHTCDTRTQLETALFVAGGGAWEDQVQSADHADENGPVFRGTSCASLSFLSRFFRCLALTTYLQPEDSEKEVKHLPRGRLSVVETIYGHVGGGGGGCKADDEFIDKEVREFLRS
jgi:hypothetical protein